MIISMIVAIADNDVIGNNNQLPWHLPEDLKKFRQLTTGHPIIMGRRTFDSIGKPLPGRTSIVITRNPQLILPEGVIPALSLDQAYELARGCIGSEEIFVIGGAEIYRQAVSRADRCYLTRVHSNPIGDTKLVNFPGEDFQLIEKSELILSQAGSVAATFQILKRCS